MRRSILLILAFFAIFSPIVPSVRAANGVNLVELEDGLAGSEAEGKFLNLVTSAKGLAIVLTALAVIVAALAIIFIGKTQAAMNVILGTVFLFGCLYILGAIYLGLK
jgi:hypothetical protein